MYNNINIFIELTVSSTNTLEEFNVLNFISYKNASDILEAEASAVEGANTRIKLINGFVDVNETKSEITDLIYKKQIL